MMKLSEYSRFDLAGHVLLVSQEMGHDHTEVSSLVAFVVQEMSQALAGQRVLLVLNPHKTHSYSGLAYKRVPWKTWANECRVLAFQENLDRMVVVNIGPAKRFPVSNIHRGRSYWKVSSPWLSKEQAGELERETIRKIGRSGWRWNTRLDDDIQEMRYRIRIWTHLGDQPYGGPMSPKIVYQTWQEGLVGVTAHELHHCVQFQQKAKRVYEYQAERASLQVLEAFRADQQDAMAATRSDQ